MYYLLSQARFFLNYLSFLFLSLFMFSLCASYQYMYIHTHTYIQLVFIVDIGGRHYCRNYSHFTPGRTDLQQDQMIYSRPNILSGRTRVCSRVCLTLKACSHSFLRALAGIANSNARLVMKMSVPGRSKKKKLLGSFGHLSVFTV